MNARKFSAEDDDPAPRGQRLLRNPKSVEKLADGGNRLPMGSRRKPPSKCQRERTLRDVAIGVLRKSGFSQRQISKVLGVSLGRVNQVLAALNARAQKGADSDTEPDEE